jgi:hypothetical protein
MFGRVVANVPAITFMDGCDLRLAALKRRIETRLPGRIRRYGPSSQAIRVVPMAAISGSIAQTENHIPSRARQPRGASCSGNVRCVNGACRSQ